MIVTVKIEIHRKIHTLKSSALKKRKTKNTYMASLRIKNEFRACNTRRRGQKKKKELRTSHDRSLALQSVPKSKTEWKSIGEMIDERLIKSPLCNFIFILSS